MGDNNFLYKVNYASFKNYVLCKAFDLIGGGTYKPYMIQCKENHDPWAIEMHKSINTVNECIRQINVLFHQIDALPNRFLSVMAKDILQTSSPPCFNAEIWGVCGISGQHTNECVNVVSSGRCTEVFTVHKKYFVFFKYFWFILKLDHIIRSVLRHWMSSNVSELSEMSKSEKCVFFTETFDIEKYHTVFNAALKHVSESLLLYVQHYESISPMQVLMQENTTEKKKRKKANGSGSTRSECKKG